jgi:hypothetical protein
MLSINNGERSQPPINHACAALRCPACNALPVTAARARQPATPCDAALCPVRPSARGQTARVSSSYGKLDAPASPTATTHMPVTTKAAHLLDWTIRAEMLAKR